MWSETFCGVEPGRQVVLSAGLRLICQPADFVLVAVWLVRKRNAITLIMMDKTAIELVFDIVQDSDGRIQRELPQ